MAWNGLSFFPKGVTLFQKKEMPKGAKKVQKSFGFKELEVQKKYLKKKE